MASLIGLVLISVLVIVVVFLVFDTFIIPRVPMECPDCGRLVKPVLKRRPSREIFACVCGWNWTYYHGHERSR